MKTVLKIILGLLGVLALIVLAGFFVPGTYRVTRSTSIAAPPAAIHGVADNLRTWLDWTAWNTNRYPDMQVKFGDKEAGPGASWSWDGPSTGAGHLTITRSEPAAGVWYDLDFEHGKFLSRGALTFKTNGPVTLVTWSQEGSMGRNPVNRWFGLLMDKMMGPDFEAGLAGLKKRAESAP